jgi:hypothetical protein
VEVLDLYRDVCRKELLLEQMYDVGVATETDLQKVRVSRQGAIHSLIEMFVKLRSRPNLPKEVIEKSPSGMVPWPDDWEDRHYNAKEPCDMLIGPCSCGAWHREDEEWVKQKLQEHEAVIV